MNIPVHKKAIIALIIANIIWGAASPIFKLALSNIAPFTLAFIRFFFASLFLLPFLGSGWRVAKKEWGKLVLVSLFGVTINISYFFWGLMLAPSINAPIIASSGPIVLYLASIIVLGEKPHKKVLIGTLVSLAGVFAIIGQPILLKRIDGELLGNLFFVIATLGAVAHALVLKRISVKIPTLTLTFWMFFIGSVSFFIPAVKENIINPFWQSLDLRGVIGILYGVFFSSILAYTLFDWGVRQIHAQDVGVFSYIDPIAAILIAIPLLGETISLIFVIGSLFVLGGIFIAEGRIHYHPVHRLAQKNNRSNRISNS